MVSAPDKQLGRIFGTAQQMASCLTNRQVAAWVTPQQADTRPRFNPQEFVGADGGTLYSPSKRGRGSMSSASGNGTSEECERWRRGV